MSFVALILSALVGAAVVGGLPDVTTTSEPPRLEPEGPTTIQAESSPGTLWRGAGLVQLPQACSDVAALGLSWYYNWQVSSPCSTSVPFVPMAWGDCGHDCGELGQRLAASGADTLLTFNEPDEPTQSNMTVERALDLWPALQASGLRMGSPAVTTDGEAWLDAFMSGIEQRGLRVDFVALHWYGDCSRPGDLVDYVTEKAARYGRPVWLTEFSCWKQSLDANLALVETVSSLADVKQLERVAWFSNRNTPDGHQYPYGYENAALIGEDGGRTPVGERYASFSSTR